MFHTDHGKNALNFLIFSGTNMKMSQKEIQKLIFKEKIQDMNMKLKKCLENQLLPMILNGKIESEKLLIILILKKEKR